MASMNNFKRLEQENKEHFESGPSREVSRGVKGNIRIIKFISEIFELYLPKAIDVLVSISGGEGNKAGSGVSDKSISNTSPAIDGRPKYPNNPEE